MNIEVDGIDFDIDINVDQEIESGLLIVDVSSVRYNDICVDEILDSKIYEKICDKAWDIVMHGRKK